MEMSDLIRQRAEPLLPGADPEQDDPDVPATWRNCKVGVLKKHGAPPAFFKACEELEMDTLGEVNTWLCAKTNRGYQDLPGVGPAAAQKIDDAYEKFWASAPQWDGQAEEDAA